MSGKTGRGCTATGRGQKGPCAGSQWAPHQVRWISTCMGLEGCPPPDGQQPCGSACGSVVGLGAPGLLRTFPRRVYPCTTGPGMSESVLPPCGPRGHSGQRSGVHPVPPPPDPTHTQGWLSCPITPLAGQQGAAEVFRGTAGVLRRRRWEDAIRGECDARCWIHSPTAWLPMDPRTAVPSLFLPLFGAGILLLQKCLRHEGGPLVWGWWLAAATHGCVTSNAICQPE